MICMSNVQVSVTGRTAAACVCDLFDNCLLQEHSDLRVLTEQPLKAIQQQDSKHWAVFL